jgi:hypothetical protein
MTVVCLTSFHDLCGPRLGGPLAGDYVAFRFRFPLKKYNGYQLRRIPTTRAQMFANYGFQFVSQLDGVGS